MRTSIFLLHPDELVLHLCPSCDVLNYALVAKYQHHFENGRSRTMVIVSNDITSLLNYVVNSKRNRDLKMGENNYFEQISKRQDHISRQ